MKPTDDKQGTVQTAHAECSAALAAEREKMRLANIDAANLLAELGDRTTPEMIEYHGDHGRGDASGPDEVDCPCRGTDKEHDCAICGCRFCKASERNLRQQLLAALSDLDKSDRDRCRLSEELCKAQAMIAELVRTGIVPHKIEDIPR